MAPMPPRVCVNKDQSSPTFFLSDGYLIIQVYGVSLLRSCLFRHPKKTKGVDSEDEIVIIYLGMFQLFA